MQAPILFIHGAFSNASHFDPWANFFARKGFSCVAPDLPGHSAGEIHRLETLTIGDYLTAMRKEASLSIHIYQESESLEARAAFRATIGNFVTRFLISTSFAALVYLLPSAYAVYACLGWGVFLLTTLTVMVADIETRVPSPRF